MLPMILVVDDNRDICSALRQILRSIGFQTEFLTDSTQAMSAIRGEPPTLLILDDMMPMLGGVELLREMKADRSLSSIPVVINSASRNEKRSQEALGLGAVAWIVKGDPAQLIEVVRRYEPHAPVA